MSLDGGMTVIPGELGAGAGCKIARRIGTRIRAALLRSIHVHLTGLLAPVARSNQRNLMSLE